jgi:hypothetical protein
VDAPGPNQREKSLVSKKVAGKADGEAPLSRIGARDSKHFLQAELTFFSGEGLSGRAAEFANGLISD